MTEYRNGTALNYVVRPADVTDRRDHPGAHQVVLLDGQSALRVMGVYRTRRIAEEIEKTLNQWVGSQIR